LEEVLELSPLPENWGGSIAELSSPQWLTEDDLKNGARLVRDWESSDDFTGYTLVIALARLCETRLNDSSSQP
jgi:hypothetical protein